MLLLLMMLMMMMVMNVVDNDDGDDNDGDDDGDDDDDGGGDDDDGDGGDGDDDVRACAVETHMNISQEPFCVEIYRNSVVRQSCDTRFVRACAVEIHIDTSQEPFCMEIYRENAKCDGYHLDWTPGLNSYRKNPSVWPHCLGNHAHSYAIIRLKMFIIWTSLSHLDFHAKVKDKIEASLKDSPGHDLLFIELAQRIETQGVPGPERQPLKGDREKVYHYHYHYSYYYYYY